MAEHHEGELLLFFGQPGSGKSTLVSHLLRHVQPLEMKVGAAFVTEWRRHGYGGAESIIELGRPDNGTGFRGSDRLTMNAITHLKPWLEGMHPSMVLAEGDRFANRSFYDWATQLWNVIPVFVHTPDELCAQRREARFKEKGEHWKFKTRTTTGPPNEKWVQGRMTKATNLAGDLPNVLVLEGASTPEYNENRLINYSKIAHWLWVRRELTAHA